MAEIFKILLVDDDETLLSSMGDFLETVAGVKCLLHRGLADVIANGSEILSGDVRLAVVDINLGHGLPSGIDVFEWLSDHHFKGTCVFLTGHAKDHPLVKNAHLKKGITVFEKPMETDKLLSLVERLKNAGTQVG